MDIRRNISIGVLALVSLLPGCHDRLSGPEPSLALEDPPLALLVPAVQQIRADPQTVLTPDGALLVVSIKATVLNDDRAKGFGFITPVNGLERFHLHFREWALSCENGSMIVELSGTGQSRGPDALDCRAAASSHSRTASDSPFRPQMGACGYR